MRKGEFHRKTGETDIKVEIDLDGRGETQISTGIGFFDHMLTGFGRHGFFDLRVEAKGDLEVDSHHTVEDTGIVLGTAIKEALGDKKGIKRFGFFILPMDEALVLVSLDLSGRPYLVYEAEYKSEKIGTLDTQLIREFFYAVSYSGEMNLHLKMLSGINSHHIAEAAFKAFAKSLKMAVSKDERIQDVLSTKGVL